MVYGIVKHFPVITLAVWGTIAAYQLYRRRVRTLTETSFLLGAAAWASYAAFDWLIFNTEDYGTAFVLGRLSLTSLTLAAFFLLVFTKLFLMKPQRTDWVLTLPLAVSLALVWDGMLLDMQGGFPWNWTGVFDPSLFLIWLLYMVVYASLAIWYVYRAFKVVRNHSTFLGWRMFGIFVSLLVTLALGLSTNTIFHSLNIPLMPLFSSFLVMPGVIVLYVLVPLTRHRISSVIAKWKSRRYRIVAAYMIYENGTLIASKTSLPGGGVDEDIFGATLDAIQTFMRTSFPVLFGKWLRRVEHGDVKILIERGSHSYIALVVEGEDTDTLWIKMAESIQRFERTNDLRLADWNGVPEDLELLHETLDDFFTEAAVFS